MASVIKIHGGDFPPDRSHFWDRGRLCLFEPRHWFRRTKYLVRDIRTLTMMDEERTRTLGLTLAGTAAGALLFGPIGLVAGALCFGNKHRVIFLAELRDGKSILGEIDRKGWLEMSTAFQAAKL